MKKQRKQEPIKSVVAKVGYVKDGYIFTEEALKAQDGKEVPLTFENQGPVIGKATLSYNEETQALEGIFQIDDPELAKQLTELPPNFLSWR